MACSAVLWVWSLAKSQDALTAGLGVEALVFGVATCASEFLAVPLPRGGWMSVATIPHVALALLFPPPLAMGIAAIAMLIQQTHAREPWLKVGFNAASSALAVGVCATVAQTLGTHREVLSTDDWQHVAILLVIGATYYALDTLLTHIVVSLTTGRSLWSALIGNSQYTLVPELGMIMVGELLALLWSWRPFWSLAIVLPAVVTYRTLYYVRRLQTETQEAVVALADLVDDRDSYTYHHSRRVAAYAEAIARELGVDADEIDLIVSAARVHDLGKVGVPDHILLKPGPLTADELETMRGHPSTGADILGRFQLYGPGTLLARHHHEWYDGRGYPDGIAGEDIPLGARILAVADAYDAMTSNRPYRRALQAEEALERLRAGQGTQFDPVVVGATMKWLSRGGQSSYG